MECLFQIAAPHDRVITKPVLSIRLGTKHCCFSITEHGTDELHQLAYYFDEEVNEPFLTDLFAKRPELNGSFYQVLVCYDHPESSLIPVKFFNPEHTGALLNTLYGVNAGSSVITEAIEQEQLFNVYAIPKELHERMNRKFGAGKYWHQSTLDMKNLDNLDAGGKLLIDFRREDFTVLAASPAKLLLTRSYLYSTPADVIYYLLRICTEFGLSQKDVKIELSGLVEQQSALYRELDQYFMNINLRTTTWKIDPAINFPCPLHFFTSLNDLSRCAS